MAKTFDDLIKRTMTVPARERAWRRSRVLLAEMLLVEMRKLTGKSQIELAKALGIKQPSLSKLENQDDMQVSTLKRIVEALGGRLEITAAFPNGAVRVNQFDVVKSNRRKASRKSS